ncbi:hypothetical protein [Tautonia sociabilis]|uniref:Uncharacterized protein n=1 Tax=Tautonia sociabilis TaxID=2080755 RepID=A0A432MEJ5_9BACT|nr:hypothetical protein [Tautonia sociabilis]RUL83939.1 hypothetical protein TsocGM_21190 [Tautonia sociabilis]
MSDEAVKTTNEDPLKAVADALDAAVQAAKQGVEGAAATASGAMPAVNGFLSGIAYKTCYAVSYGVVFPTVLVARAIPKENAAVHGLIDGARAAMDLVDEMKSKPQGAEPPSSGTPSGAGGS